jgi:hypothetical protein
MRRIEGWEARLLAVTRKSLAKKFEWGTNDCCIFVADCILAITGDDLASEFRGTYSTEAQAKKMMITLDCHGVGDVASRYLPEISPKMARRGDIVLIEGIYGDFLAVVDGRTAVGPTQEGQLHSPKGLAKRAWRVG